MYQTPIDTATPRASSPVASECHICLANDNGPLVTLGCACRGTASKCHLACKIAEATSSEKFKGPTIWWECSICKQAYSGHTRVAMADAYCKHQVATLATRCLSTANAVQHRLIALRNCGRAHLMAHNHSKSEQYFKNAVQIALMLSHSTTVPEAVQKNCPNMALALCDLASSLVPQGRHIKARDLLEQSAAIIEKTHKPSDDMYQMVVKTKAMLLIYEQRFFEAKQCLENVYLLSTARRGPTDHQTLTARSNFAYALLKCNDPSALRECRATFQGRRTVLGPLHPDTLASQCTLGYATLAAGNLSEAIGHFQHIVDSATATKALSHPTATGAMVNLALAMTVQTRLSDAAVWHHRATLHAITPLIIPTLAEISQRAHAICAPPSSSPKHIGAV